MISTTKKIIPVYSADNSGVCSALYELDGLNVIHDASGCNSTYNTHDEPRWYDKTSRVFLSGLVEYDIILGNERPLIDDCVRAAKDLKPRFISLAPSPVSCVLGQDIKAVGRVIEKKTGLPVIAIETSGMHTYIDGGSKALVEYAKRFVKAPTNQKRAKLTINILGATPLDFGRENNTNDMKTVLEEQGLSVNSIWAMGSTIDEIDNSANVDVNLVISKLGLPLAEYFEDTYGIPWVLGIPWGEENTKILTKKLIAKKSKDLLDYKNDKKAKIAIVGEPVQSATLAALIKGGTQCVSLLGKVRDDDIFSKGEEEIENILSGYETVIADPIYSYLVKKGTKFIPFPHFAFSGRIYKKDIKSLAGAKGDAWVEKNFF